MHDAETPALPAIPAALPPGMALGIGAMAAAALAMSIAPSLVRLADGGPFASATFFATCAPIWVASFGWLLFAAAVLIEPHLLPRSASGWAALLARALASHAGGPGVLSVAPGRCFVAGDLSRSRRGGRRRLGRAERGRHPRAGLGRPPRPRRPLVARPRPAAVPASPASVAP